MEPKECSAQYGVESPKTFFARCKYRKIRVTHYFLLGHST